MEGWLIRSCRRRIEDGRIRSRILFNRCTAIDPVKPHGPAMHEMKGVMQRYSDKALILILCSGSRDQSRLPARNDNPSIFCTFKNPASRVNDAETRARSPMKRSAVSPSDDGDESDIDDRTAEVRHPL